MVILDVDHRTSRNHQNKARELHKIGVLRDAGFDMDLGGKDIVTVQYQNANNSSAASTSSWGGGGERVRPARRPTGRW